MGTYTYTSTVSVPYRFMSLNKAQGKQDDFRQSSDKMTLEKYTGGEPKFVTNPGPIYIAASNGKFQGQHKLRLPVVVDTTKIKPIPFNFQLHKNDEDLNGNVQDILEIDIDVPTGIRVHCTNINNNEVIPGVPRENGKTRVTIEYEDIEFNLEDIVHCFLDVPNTEAFFPTQTDWSEHSVTLSVTYDYAQKKQGIIEVI